MPRLAQQAALASHAKVQPTAQPICVDAHAATLVFDDNDASRPRTPPAIVIADLGAHACSSDYGSKSSPAKAAHLSAARLG